MLENLVVIEICVQLHRAERKDWTKLSVAHSREKIVPKQQRGQLSSILRACSADRSHPHVLHSSHAQAKTPDSLDMSGSVSGYLWCIMHAQTLLSRGSFTREL